MRAAMLGRLENARAVAAEADRLPLPKLFCFLPLSLLLAVAIGVCLWLAYRHGGGGVSATLPTLAVAAGAPIAVWLLGFFLSQSVIRRAADELGAARLLEVSAEQESAARVAALDADIRAEADEESQNLGETFRESDTEWRQRIHRGQTELDARYALIPERLEKLHQRKSEKIETAHQAGVAQAQAAADERKRGIDAARAGAEAEITGEFAAAISGLAGPWDSAVVPDFQSLAELEKTSRAVFPAWTPEVCANWSPPEEAPAALRIGAISVDAAKLAGGLPHDARLALPGDLTVPLSLGFPDRGSLMIETAGDGADQAARALNAISLRLLASQPPGRASFVFIDPVGLGKDFAGLMHLADYEETLINHRIWTQSTQIEERLAELNEHIEKVIQMYLRNEFANLAEYNAQAGTIAEKYRFLVIAGFPASFSETACKRLHSTRPTPISSWMTTIPRRAC